MGQSLTLEDRSISQPDRLPEHGAPPGRPASQPAFNLHGAIVMFVVTCVGVHVMRTIVFDGTLDRWLTLNFAFIPARYMPDYIRFDWPTLVSPVTYAFLHGDWVHLGFNMIWLVAFGAPVAYRLGWARTIALWVLTALGAVALHAAIYLDDPVPLWGASGAVSGFLGAAARFGFRANRRNPRAGFAGPLLGPLASLRQRGVIAFLVIWVAINVATGLDWLGMAGGASIAWEAHIGGLLVGFFGIGLLDPGERSAAR